MQNVLVRPQIAVIQPHGALNAACVGKFQRQLDVAIASNQHSKLVVDMKQVESIDSAGLMALISALTRAQALNKGFSLCSVPHPVRIVLELTQLDGVFEILEEQVNLSQIAA